MSSLFFAEINPVTLELAWWINQLTEVITVLAASRLENLDKMTWYVS